MRQLVRDPLPADRAQAGSQPLAGLLAAAGLGVLSPGDPDLAATAITRVTEDSRRVIPGALFVAIAGSQSDGLAFVDDAVAGGAAAVVAAAPRPAEADPRVPWLQVARPRAALADLAAAFHGFPGRSLRLSAVTGSKGKTTTAFLMRSIAAAAGEPTALLSTVLWATGQDERPASLTTQSAPVLQALLAEAVAANQTGAVVEVSSHAIDQDRTRGLQFATAVFTNLFPDHLDYHGTVEHYAATKRRLFVGEQAAERVAIGVGDPVGQALAAERTDAITFALEAPARVIGRNVRSTADGLRLEIEADGVGVEAHSPLLGRHNAGNLIAAFAYGRTRGFDATSILAGIRTLPSVPGRLEPIVAGQPFQCIVDFAHTGPSLTAALRSVREWTRGRVIAVFGAGGNRDPERRRGMGEAAAQLADLSILTNDNPRDEDPQAILAAIDRAFAAAGGGRAQILPDRTEAIAHAVALARPGDTVLIAGKGHEREQLVGAERRPFDDREVARAALADRGFAP